MCVSVCWGNMCPNSFKSHLIKSKSKKLRLILIKTLRRGQRSWLRQAVLIKLSRMLCPQRTHTYTFTSYACICVWIHICFPCRSAACRGPLWSCLRQAANADTCLTCSLTVCIAAWQTLHTLPPSTHSSPHPSLSIPLFLSLLAPFWLVCVLVSVLNVTSIYLFATSVVSWQ